MHKRGLSALLSVVMTLSILPALPASALENDEPFPYTLFAGSDEDGAITINADNVCLNGSVVTNGSIETAATNFNVNGQRIEHAQQPMVYAFGKLDDAYFDSDTVLTYESDYTVEDVNISLNTPIVSTGNISLNGNINLNTQLKAEEDILVSGGSCNANNAALISHHGDIYIESTNFGFAGLIYAPYGDIVIDSSSPSAANVIGTISEDPDDHHEDAGIYFYAVGAYNAEISTIDIAWSGSDVPATVDVLTATDGETYSVVTSVTDATTYAYPVGNDFVSTYFKVSYIDANGDIVESIPFQAIVTEDGITIDYPDSDGDGIVDLLEAILGIDPSKIDTDDDGLTDYQELNITGTDPTDYDSVEKRISDADADCDGDGISNLEDIELGTDPQVLDSDDDGLTDGEEVNTYLTDPLLEDTDGDGLTDGFEVRYGLDPLSPYTNGIADAEHKIEQTISADSPVLSEVNTSDSPYEMSISITTNGDAERGLAVIESGYSISLENDAQIGGITDLNLSDSCDPDSTRLTYAIKDAYRSNTLNKYSEFEDLQGIKRLCVFKYFDEISMMLPLDTQYDLENNIIYADVNDGGTYCVMDLEVWFDLFDISLEEIESEMAHFSNSSHSTAPVQYLPRNYEANKVPIDLVFILQTAGPNHAQSVYQQELDLMESVTDYVLENYRNARVYVIDYKFDNAEVLKFGGRDYCTNVTALSRGIRNIKYDEIDQLDFCDTTIPFNLLKNELELRQNVNTYIYHMHNGSNTYSTPYDDGISICESTIGIFSQVVPDGYAPYGETEEDLQRSQQYWQDLDEAIENNDGINIVFDDNASQTVIDHIGSNLDYILERTEYDALLGTTLKKVTLKTPLNPTNGTDSDDDTLTDWEEVDASHITIDMNGYISLPTVEVLIAAARLYDTNEILVWDVYNYSAKYMALSVVGRRQVLPCLSDPTLKDTDGDEVLDNSDFSPQKGFNNEFILVNSINYTPQIDFMNPNKLGTGNTEYNEKYGTPIVDGRDSCYNRRAATLEDEKNFALLSLEAQLSEVPLITNIAGKYISTKEWCTMYNAADFLLWFLSNTGQQKTLTANEMIEIIKSEPSNLFHYMQNVNRLMELGEDTLCDGDSYIFASDGHDTKVCCYTGKHCNETHYWGHSGELSYLRTDESYDWAYAIGESFGGLVCQIQRTGTSYTMTFRYILMDYYEWGYHVDGGDKEQHMLHECGLAREYPIFGSVINSISWNKGYRLSRAEDVLALVSQSQAG